MEPNDTSPAHGLPAMTTRRAKLPVLIVDDSRTVRLQLETMLSVRFECHTADSGEAGVARARAMQPPPSAILMDVRMPGIGGIEALRTLRADPAFAQTPIVMVTTRGEEEVIAECRAAGCTAYVNKPVQTQELFTVMDSLLGGRGLR